MALIKGTKVVTVNASSLELEDDNEVSESLGDVAVMLNSSEDDVDNSNYSDALATVEAAIADLVAIRDFLATKSKE